MSDLLADEFLTDEIKNEVINAIRAQIRRMNVPIRTVKQANEAIERSKIYAKLCKIYKIPIESLFK